MKITIDDVRKAGYCVSGARGWFRQHEIPFDVFLREGMDADEFLARGDELAAVVVQKKLDRESANG